MNNFSDVNFSLSILLVVYNHERYVECALESILGQVFPGHFLPVEILVADDASTDRTLDIIRSFDGRDSRFVFNYLPSQSNVGITRNYQRGFAACAGDYVAVLEGDDYWSSSEKLNRQIQILNENPDCVLCAVNCTLYHERDGKFFNRATAPQEWRNISAPELIKENIISNFSTCMYRRSALRQLPEALYSIKAYDWIINIFMGSLGRIVFLNEPMSVYRIHDAGVWSGLGNMDKIKIRMDVIPIYDSLTGGRYRAEFEALLSALRKDYAASKKSLLSKLWKVIKTEIRGKFR